MATIYQGHIARCGIPPRSLTTAIQARSLSARTGHFADFFAHVPALSSTLVQFPSYRYFPMLSRFLFANGLYLTLYAMPIYIYPLSHSLHPEDGGSIVLRSGGVLPHHYMMSQPRRPWLHSEDGSSMVLWNGGILPHHYTVLQPRRSWLHSEDGGSMVLRNGVSTHKITTST